MTRDMHFDLAGADGRQRLLARREEHDVARPLARRPDLDVHPGLERIVRIDVRRGRTRDVGDLLAVEPRGGGHDHADHQQRRGHDQRRDPVAGHGQIAEAIDLVQVPIGARRRGEEQRGDVLKHHRHAEEDEQGPRLDHRGVEALRKLPAEEKNVQQQPNPRAEGRDQRQRDERRDHHRERAGPGRAPRPETALARRGAGAAPDRGRGDRSGSGVEPRPMII